MKLQITQIPLFIILVVSAFAMATAPKTTPAAVNQIKGSESAETSWPASGTLIVDFSLDQDIYPQDTLGAASSAVSLPLLESPLFDVSVENQNAIVRLLLSIKRKAPLRPLSNNFGQIMWSHLKADKAYQLAFAWDIESNRFDVYLNGTLQEVSSSITVPYWEDGQPNLAGTWKLEALAKHGRLYDEAYDHSTIAAIAQKEAIPSIAGEGRTLYEDPLEISSEGLELLYAADFTKPLDLTLEKELFEGDERVREPDTEWILEGDGTATVIDGGVKLETNRFTLPSRWENGGGVWERPAHLNLFLNQRMPDRILVEYDLDVWDPHHGLHILFFSATHPNGGSIFQPGVSLRDGDFRKNILTPDEYLSYHVSFWAAPYDIIRRSSNLRKNGKFLLQAVGDDRIVYNGNGPHRIRVLKDGPRIAAEVNGVKIIDFEDDPEIYGPIFTDGYLGLRMMGFAKWIKVSDFKVYALD